MTQSLFRPEVLQARRTSWLGSISVAQPIQPWVLTAFAVAAALAAVLLLVFGNYTRRTRVSGQLVPTQGIATVLAPATGVVTRVDVPEGGRVAVGQLIATVVMPRATVTEGDTATALESRIQRRAEALKAWQSAQNELLKSQADGLSAELRAALRELAQLEAEISTGQQRVRLAEESLQTLQKLHRDKYISEWQLRQQQATSLDELGDVQVLQRQAIATRSRVAKLKHAMLDLPNQHEGSQAQFQRDIALLEQEQLETHARGEFAIVAPTRGIIATQFFQPGQTVQEGQPLLSVLPGDGTLEAELLVPTRAIGFLQPGDVVRLRYHAYPYQKFGHQRGRISRISRSTVTDNSSAHREADHEPRYRVNVRLERQAITAYGKPEPLKPGMLLDADVLGEKRSLLEWILEPLYSIKGTVLDQ